MRTLCRMDFLLADVLAVPWLVKCLWELRCRLRLARNVRSVAWPGRVHSSSYRTTQTHTAGTLGVLLNDNALYKSMHSLIHSLTATDTRTHARTHYNRLTALFLGLSRWADTITGSDYVTRQAVDTGTFRDHTLYYMTLHSTTVPPVAWLTSPRQQLRLMRIHYVRLAIDWKYISK